jgi:hypothetical protein
MDDEQGGRRSSRLKVAGIVTAAVLAVPGGMVISNAFAADGDGADSSTTPAQQTVPYGSDAPAPQRGDRDHDGDCPGMGDHGGRGDDSGAAPSSPDTPSTEGTGYTMQ